MKQYLLSVMQPDGEPPEAAILEEIGRNLEAFHAELHAAGAWEIGRASCRERV